MNLNQKLIIGAKYALYATALTPIIVSRSTLFPFAFGKIMFFRACVEVAIILFCVAKAHEYFIKTKKEDEGRKDYRKLTHPLVLSVVAFFVSWIVSATFAVNKYRAFWGDLERGEGVFGMMHFVAFFILAVLLFNEKDWLRMFGIYVVGGVVIALYGVFQYLGIEQVPFSFQAKERAESFVGNSAFLAIHMLFVIVCSFLMLLKSKKKSIIRYFLYLMFPISVIVMLLTQTRGPVLGLGAGILMVLLWLVIKSDKKVVRGVSIFILICGFISGAVFWGTRSHSVWQGIPGLGRLANTATFDRYDPSTQTRLIVWKTSWNAFKEKPIMGWGPENYLMAYLKYYDPDSALYGEAWFDRAHNKILDVLVMNGIFGMVIYSVLLGAVLYTARKHEKNERVILYGFFTAYFVQNLVLFDQILSYITLATLLGYMVFVTERKSKNNKIDQDNIEDIEHHYIGEKGREGRVVYGVVWCVLAIGTATMFYLYTFIPYAQARAFVRARGGNEIEFVMREMKNATEPYNFIQANMRGHIIDAYFKQQPEIFEKPFFTPLANQLILMMDDVLAREPYDPRQFIRVIEIINLQARNEDKIYAISEDLAREALELAPKRQELYYHLAFVLAGRGKLDKSLEVVREAIELSPNVARSHYHLALMLALGDDSMQEEAKKELAKAMELDPELRTMVGFDTNNIGLLYASWGEDDKVAELALRTVRGETTYFSERKYYERALRYLISMEMGSEAIEIAKYLKKSEDMKDSMEIIIDLINKGRWDIIEKL